MRRQALSKDSPKPLHSTGHGDVRLGRLTRFRTAKGYFLRIGSGLVSMDSISIVC